MGRIFGSRSIAIQAELRKIHEELTQAKGEFTGQVSVAMSGVASIAIIQAVLRKFETKFTRALLKLTETMFHGAEADILAGEVDFFVSSEERRVGKACVSSWSFGGSPYL